MTTPIWTLLSTQPHVGTTHSQQHCKAAAHRCLTTTPGQKYYNSTLAGGAGGAPHRKGYRIPETRYIKQMPGDGNCLYHALSASLEQITTQRISHTTLRQQIAEHVATSAAFRARFFDDRDLANVVRTIRTDGAYGDSLSIEAMCNIYKVAVKVYLPNAVPILFQPPHHYTQCLAVAFNNVDHYNAVLTHTSLSQAPVNRQSTRGNNKSHQQTPNSHSQPPAGQHRTPPPQAPNATEHTQHTSATKTLTLLSINVNTWQKHRDALLAEADILAIQETRLTAKGQQAEGKILQSQQRTACFGAPCPPITFHKAGGTRIARAASNQGKQGGVAIITSALHPHIQTTRGPTAQSLFASTRWTRTAVCLGHQRSPSRHFLHIISFYNVSGHDQGLIRTRKNRLLEAVFEDAAQFGDQPILICADANATVATSHVLAFAIRSGHWIDLAQHFVCAQPTYCANKEWDKTTKTKGATRPDLILANKAALPLITSCQVRRNLSPRGHLGLQVTINAEQCKHTIKQLKLPKAYRNLRTPGAAHTQQMVDAILQEHRATFEHARTTNTDKAWRIFAQMSEKVLSCMETTPCGQGGRHGQLRFEQRKITLNAASKNVPDVTATYRTQEAYKNHRRLQEAWIKLSTNSCSTQSASDFSSILLKFNTYARTAGLSICPTPPSKQNVSSCIQELEEHISTMQSNKANERIRQWKAKLRYDFQQGGRQTYAWLRDEWQPPLTALQHKHDLLTNPTEMVSAIRDAWDELINRNEKYSWQDFHRRYAHHITHRPCTLSPITLEDVKAQLKRANKHRAVAADGWRLAEMRHLPDKLLLLVVDLLNDHEQGAWAQAGCTAIITCIPKGTINLDSEEEAPHPAAPQPLGTRPISNISPWSTMYTGIRYRHLSEWRESLQPQSMHGARKGHETTDVALELALDIEYARTNGMHLAGIALDRQKFFDLLSHDILWPLLRSLGLPEQILLAERTFYAKLRSYYKLRDCYSAESRRSNGFIQGCSFSIQASLALLSIWTKVLESTVQSQPLESTLSTGSYLDDSNIRCIAPTHKTAVQHLLKAWEASLEFDNHAGIKVNAAKSTLFATTADSEAEVKETFKSSGHHLDLQRTFTLVGGSITARGHPDRQRRNQRCIKAKSRGKKIRYVPLAFAQRAQLAQSAVVPIALSGTEHIPLTMHQKEGLRRLISKALWKGYTWCRAPGITMTLIVPGHLIDPFQAEKYHTLRLLRRYLQRSPAARQRFEAIHAQLKTHQKRGSGPVARMFKSTTALGCQWPSCWTIRMPTGEELPLIDGDNPTWHHQLRDLLRQSVWGEKPLRSRKDMDGVQNTHYAATVKLLRLNPKSKKALTPMQRTHLRTLLCGAIQSQERLRHAGFTEDAMCPYCKNAPETVEHILWHCDKYVQLRRAFHQRYSQEYCTTLPACTRLCGIVTKQTGIDEADLGAFATALQTMCISILEARETWKQKIAHRTAAQNAPSSAREPPATPVEVPAGATAEQLFPGYPWRFQHEEVTTERTHIGDAPDNWRRYSKSAEWLFSLDLFPALVWYFRQLRWPAEAMEETVTWLELALDFQCATHVMLRPDTDDDIATHHAEKQARTFAAAAKRMQKDLWRRTGATGQPIHPIA